MPSNSTATEYALLVFVGGVGAWIVAQAIGGMLLTFAERVAGIAAQLP